MKAAKRTINEHKFARIWNDSFTRNRMGVSLELDGFSLAEHGDHIYICHFDATVKPSKTTYYRFEKEVFDWEFKFNTKTQVMYNGGFNFTSIGTVIWRILTQ